MPSIEQTLHLQDFPKSSLYIVSTPIGNMGDITYRAVYILSEVDGIACEDTRHTQQLLNSLGIQKPLMAIHDHNEMESSARLIEQIQNGQRWAYVSDAGTPGISDPGSRLVNAVSQAGLRVIPIPGVSAITAAISVSGKTTLSSDGKFQFFGFLPTKGRPRKDQLEMLSSSTLATVFYESPQRIKETLIEISQLLSGQSRTVMIGRELTKKFESVNFVDASNLEDWVNSENPLKGEFCIILEGKSEILLESNINQSVTISTNKLAEALSEHLGSKQIAEVFAQAGILTKNQAYELAIEIKNKKQ